MEHESYEYTTFPKQFLSYKWFKPLLVGALTALFAIVFQMTVLLVVSFVLGGQEAVNQALDRNNPMFYQAPGLILSLGGIALFTPALALAALIVKDRPFSSYSSSRGGFNWGAFVKYLLVSFVLLGALMGLFTFVFPGDGDGVVKFSVGSFVLFSVLVLFQGAGEEYLFRGLIMQTVASWTNLPVVGMAVSTLVFAISHSYDIFGIIAVCVDGFAMAFLAWRTRGLEVSCALHGVHNFFVLAMSGLGFVEVGSGGLEGLVQVVVMQAVYVAVIMLIENKFHWCTPKGDGVTAFNERYRAKMESKQQ